MLELESSASRVQTRALDGYDQIMFASAGKYNYVNLSESGGKYRYAVHQTEKAEAAHHGDYVQSVRRSSRAGLLRVVPQSSDTLRRRSGTLVRRAGADRIRCHSFILGPRVKSPPADKDMGATDPDIPAQRVSQYQLSAEAVEKIYDVMERTGMSFADAALHLGFIRKQDIAGGDVPSGRTDKHGPQAGLIEMAINRISAGRDVVLRQGSEVTPGPRLQVVFDKANPRYEKMRALRTELLLLNETSNSANIMAILSPGSGEGRSQLCAELAISFAQLGRRTLLVDADMRTPRQHVLFGSRNEFGLSQAISQNTKPYLHPVKGLGHMFLLTAGTIPSNPLELLSDARRCERFYDRLAGRLRIRDHRYAARFAVF